MRIHAVASRPHYIDHLKPIWDHFPEGTKGEFLTGKNAWVKGHDPQDVVMVAGFSDIELARYHRVIMVEHGSGQRYTGIPKSLTPYYGGPYPENVIAYLGPREDVVVAASLPGFASGSPICDPYELYGEDSVCAITFHWKGNRVCPEAGTALNHYVASLPKIVQTLREAGWEVLGHRHPRLVHPVNLWSRLGVEEVDVDTVRRRASLLIADNTSLAYEMAYLGRQNISLNCPEYRRDVNHGLRFWDCPPGPQVDSAEELIEVASDIIGYLPRVYASTAATAAYGKTHSDGLDGFRSAAWVTMALSAI